MTSATRRIAGKNNAMQADMVSRHPAATKADPRSSRPKWNQAWLAPFLSSFFSIVH